MEPYLPVVSNLLFLTQRLIDGTKDLPDFMELLYDHDNNKQNDYLTSNCFPSLFRMV